MLLDVLLPEQKGFNEEFLKTYAEKGSEALRGSGEEYTTDNARHSMLE